MPLLTFPARQRVTATYTLLLYQPAQTPHGLYTLETQVTSAARQDRLAFCQIRPRGMDCVYRTVPLLPLLHWLLW
jgi:hypothetical protein